MIALRGDKTTALLAALSITASAVAYLVRGEVPDFMVLLDTTLLGGFLGMSVPSKSS